MYEVPGELLSEMHRLREELRETLLRLGEYEKTVTLRDSELAWLRKRELPQFYRHGFASAREKAADMVIDLFHRAGLDGQIHNQTDAMQVARAVSAKILGMTEI